MLTNTDRWTLSTYVSRYIHTTMHRLTQISCAYTGVHIDTLMNTCT